MQLTVALRNYHLVILKLYITPNELVKYMSTIVFFPHHLGEHENAPGEIPFLATTSVWSTLDSDTINCTPSLFIYRLHSGWGHFAPSLAVSKDKSWNKEGMNERMNEWMRTLCFLMALAMEEFTQCSITPLHHTVHQTFSSLFFSPKNDLSGIWSRISDFTCHSLALSPKQTRITAGHCC